MYCFFTYFPNKLHMLFNMFPRNSLQGEKLYNFSKLLKKNRAKKLFGKHKQLLSYT